MSDVRQFAFQMFGWLGALSQFGSAAEDFEEFKIPALFCGLGLDTSLWCFASQACRRNLW